MNELITKDYVFVKNNDGAMLVSPEAIQGIHDIEVAKKNLEKSIKKYNKILL